MSLDLSTLARCLHVAAIVGWIGGVWFGAPVGLAPVHALALGFAGSLLAASGRDPGGLLVVTAGLCAARMQPWLQRDAAIYLAARRDGKPG